MIRRCLLATTVSGVLVAAVLHPAQTSGAGSGPVAPSAPGAAAVLLDWQATAFATVYGPTPIPTGVPLLGYTSVAVQRAVARARERGNASAVAAAAAAAHGVLTHYFPAATLDDELAASLASVPDGEAQTRGVRTGRRAAARMVARVADPRENPEGIVYDRAPAAGVWQPPVTDPPTSFLAPWLGFLDPLVSDRPIRVDGPDALRSRQYALDVEEVKRVGALTGADRTDHQADTAQFFNSNSASMVGQAVANHLRTHPIGVRRTARLFAVMHGSMTDAIITCWRLKYDHAYWRPFQAIQGAATDGNPATTPDTAWEPLIGNPPYPDYVSGHGCLTAPAVETVRLVLGEETSLVLHSFNPIVADADRTYETLTQIEFDAFHARIWGGLHFRDAMDDAYLIGHVAAHRAARALR